MSLKTLPGRVWKPLGPLSLETGIRKLALLWSLNSDTDSVYPLHPALGWNGPADLSTFRLGREPKLPGKAASL